MPARRNACAMCRKKRIKCDLTQPHCLMCQRFGRICPGPPDEPIIIDMTSATAQRQEKRQNRGTKAENPASSKVSCDLSIQVSQRNVMNEVFYGRFMTYFSQTGETEDLQSQHTWLHKLPDMSADGTDSALTLALHATSSAFSSLKTRNQPLAQDSFSLYGRALRLHSHGLRTKKQVTTHMVSTSVLLSLFEAMNATTASAYREHINGAARLVAIASSNQMMLEVSCPVIFHIRTQMAFIYLTTQKEDQDSMCAEQALQQSLSNDRLPIFQKLMTHIMKLASIHIGLGKTRGSNGEASQMINLQTYMEVKHEVDALWLEYQELAEAKGEQISWTTKSQTTEYRSAFTALTIAYFASARILFSILAPRLAASFPDLTDHYALILEVASFLESYKTGCAFMRMATPLFLVGMHAPDASKRDAAISIFEGWKLYGLTGVSAMALDRIYADRVRREEVATPMPMSEISGLVIRQRGHWDSDEWIAA